MSVEFFHGKLAELIQTLENYYELTGITIAENTKDNKIRFITSYPESWMNRYHSNRYYEDDLVHELGLHSQSTYFFWGSALYTHSTEAQKEIFEEACEYDIQSGLTFNFQDFNSPSMISIAFPYSDQVSSKLPLGVIDELKSNMYTIRVLMQLSAYNLNEQYLNHLTLRSNKLLSTMYTTNATGRVLQSSIMRIKGLLKCLPVSLRSEGEVLLSMLEEERRSIEEKSY